MPWKKNENGNFVNNGITVYKVKDDYGFAQDTVWAWVYNKDNTTRFSDSCFSSFEAAILDSEGEIR